MLYALGFVIGLLTMTFDYIGRITAAIVVCAVVFECIYAFGYNATRHVYWNDEESVSFFALLPAPYPGGLSEILMFSHGLKQLPDGLTTHWETLITRRRRFWISYYFLDAVNGRVPCDLTITSLWVMKSVKFSPCVQEKIYQFCATEKARYGHKFRFRMQVRKVL